jgi:hypothetical protein
MPKERNLLDLALSLTPREEHILTHSPYENPADWGTSKVARRLEKQGLLESHPTCRTTFRVTELGAAVAKVARQLRC